MLQRSKAQRSSRRTTAPAKDADVPGTAPETQDAAVAFADGAIGDAVEAPAPTAPDPDPAAAESLDAVATPTDPATGGIGMPADPATPGIGMPTDPATPGIDMLTDPATPGIATPANPVTAGIAPVVDAARAAGIPGTSIVATPVPVPMIAQPNFPAASAAPQSPPPRTRFAFGTNLMETPMQQASKATETMMKAAEEAVEFGRGNVEAMTKATQIYVAGVQDLGKLTFAVVQGMADHAMESAKALSGVKSLQEAVQIQSSFARAAIEKSVSESAKLGETALKLTEQTFAPITARMSLAAEKITKVPAAA